MGRLEGLKEVGTRGMRECAEQERLMHVWDNWVDSARKDMGSGRWIGGFDGEMW
jgi:hypothetical protein